jgi:serine/threonine protein kinase
MTTPSPVKLGRFSVKGATTPITSMPTLPEEPYIDPVEIGYGAAGCAFKPAFQCKQRKKLPGKTYISKLMRNGKNAAMEEINRYKSLDLTSIPNFQDYFIADPELCDLNLADVEFMYKAVTSKKTDCTDIKLSDPLYAINYLYGGKDLYSFFEATDKGERDINYVMLLRALANIFQGVALLHAKGIYHYDLKPENIVLDESVVPPKFKIIDFGLSSAIPMKENKENKDYKKIGTPGYMPPEMYLLKSADANYDELLIKGLNVHYFAQGMEFPPSVVPPLSYYQGLPFEKRYNKSDIWALGMILYNMYTFIDNTDEIKEHVRTKLNLNKLVDVIDHLFKFDVDKRPNAEKALELYLEFLHTPPEVSGRSMSGRSMSRAVSSRAVRSRALSRASSTPIKRIPSSFFTRRKTFGGSYHKRIKRKGRKITVKKNRKERK